MQALRYLEKLFSEDMHPDLCSPELCDVYKECIGDDEFTCPPNPEPDEKGRAIYELLRFTWEVRNAIVGEPIDGSEEAIKRIGKALHELNAAVTEGRK